MPFSLQTMLFWRETTTKARTFSFSFTCWLLKTVNIGFFSKPEHGTFFRNKICRPDAKRGVIGWNGEGLPASRPRPGLSPDPFQLLGEQFRTRCCCGLLFPLLLHVQASNYNWTGCKHLLPWLWYLISINTAAFWRAHFATAIIPVPIQFPRLSFPSPSLGFKLEINDFRGKVRHCNFMILLSTTLCCTVQVQYRRALWWLAESPHFGW